MDQETIDKIQTLYFRIKLNSSESAQLKKAALRLLNDKKTTAEADGDYKKDRRTPRDERC